MSTSRCTTAQNALHATIGSADRVWPTRPPIRPVWCRLMWFANARPDCGAKIYIDYIGCCRIRRWAGPTRVLLIPRRIDVEASTAGLNDNTTRLVDWAMPNADIQRHLERNADAHVTRGRHEYYRSVDSGQRFGNRDSRPLDGSATLKRGLDLPVWPRPCRESLQDSARTTQWHARCRPAERAQ
jgi:hypothetical protein